MCSHRESDRGRAGNLGEIPREAGPPCAGTGSHRQFRPGEESACSFLIEAAIGSRNPSIQSTWQNRNTPDPSVIEMHRACLQSAARAAMPRAGSAAFFVLFLMFPRTCDGCENAHRCEPRRPPDHGEHADLATCPCAFLLMSSPHLCRLSARASATAWNSPGERPFVNQRVGLRLAGASPAAVVIIRATGAGV